jgi:ABC-type amino acid transport substrate-binding protein
MAVLVLATAACGSATEPPKLFSVEPYAFALRRGDPDFRLAVNRGLSGTYRSGNIVQIFNRWFSPLKPSAVLISVYELNSMEE